VCPSWPTARPGRADLASGPTLSVSGRCPPSFYRIDPTPATSRVTIDANEVTSAPARQEPTTWPESPGPSGLSANHSPASTVPLKTPSYRERRPGRRPTITVGGPGLENGPPPTEIIETQWPGGFTRLVRMGPERLSGRIAPLALIITRNLTALASKPKLTIVGTARLAHAQNDRKRPGLCPGPDRRPWKKAGAAPGRTDALHLPPRGPTVAQVSRGPGRTAGGAARPGDRRPLVRSGPSCRPADPNHGSKRPVHAPVRRPWPCCLAAMTISSSPCRGDGLLTADRRC